MIDMYIFRWQRESPAVGRYPTEPTELKAEEIVVEPWPWKWTILERY